MKANSLSNLRLTQTFPNSEYQQHRRETITFQIDHTPLNDGCDICLTFGESYGVPYRYLELNAADARRLAENLLVMAQTLDQIQDEAANVRVLRITEG